MIEKYYLIYIYHDLFMEEFYDEKSMMEYLKKLKSDYKYDSDFKYKVIKGIEILNNYTTYF